MKRTKFEKSIEYTNLVAPILENEEFQKIKNFNHHGISRYEHSIRVSYYSYKVTKFLRLDYENTARGALLHDFFISPDVRTKTEKIKSTFVHPKKAVQKSLEEFELNEKEENIIHAHMFPIYFSLPKYAESWVVTLTDKVVATCEFGSKFTQKLRKAS